MLPRWHGGDRWSNCRETEVLGEILDSEVLQVYEATLGQDHWREGIHLNVAVSVLFVFVSTKDEPKLAAIVPKQVDFGFA